jgi:hypothetical protein
MGNGRKRSCKRRKKKREEQGDGRVSLESDSRYQKRQE